ncbi:MAG: formate dehydrogenase subunit gamma [Betaproteobacteria bacterium]
MAVRMPGTRLYRRFDAVDRTLHIGLMASFLGLALTGLPLFFSTSDWASRIAHALGGFHAAGLIHRAAATLLITVFLIHLGRVLKRLAGGDLGILWGPASMVPQPRDIVELYQHVQWFLGLGPRPRFGRYTYWEKFDYWAVFWGMGIIGASGLMLWFPTVFARVVPGWMFNVAMLVHGEEALLAVVFIFTVHFFNTHMRPEKFPMDRVIFTGRLTERELREERPDEYELLRRSGGLDSAAVGPAAGWLLPFGRVVAVVALTTGFTIVFLIVLTVVSQP